MFVQQKNSALPKPVEITALLVHQYKITNAHYDAFTVPAEVREKFDKHWGDVLAKLPPGLKAVSFNIKSQPLYIHESRLGSVFLEAEIIKGSVELWLAVGDPHDRNGEDENGEPLWVRVAASVMKRDKETDEWLDKVWRAFSPVKPLRAVKQIMPNAPCPCKSGKKFKKCCGRIV